MGRRKKATAAAQAAPGSAAPLAPGASHSLDRGQLADCLSQTSKIAAECNSILRDLLRGRQARQCRHRLRHVPAARSRQSMVCIVRLAAHCFEACRTWEKQHRSGCRIHCKPLAQSALIGGHRACVLCGSLMRRGLHWRRPPAQPHPAVVSTPVRCADPRSTRTCSGWPARCSWASPWA